MLHKTIQKQLNGKIQIISCVVLSLLILLFIGQRAVAEAQTVNEKLFKTELVIESGHASYVESVTFSPDGKLLASGSYDETVRLWKVETGQELKSLKGGMSKRGSNSNL